MIMFIVTPAEVIVTSVTYTSSSSSCSVDRVSQPFFKLEVPLKVFSVAVFHTVTRENSHAPLLFMVPRNSSGTGAITFEKPELKTTRLGRYKRDKQNFGDLKKRGIIVFNHGDILSSHRRPWRVLQHGCATALRYLHVCCFIGY